LSIGVHDVYNLREILTHDVPAPQPIPNQGGTVNVYRNEVGVTDWFELTVDCNSQAMFGD
jgi:hypothetical protein